MIIIDEKFLGRPVTRDMATMDFLHEGAKVLAVSKENGKIIAFQLYDPKYHGLQEIRNPEFTNANWYLYYEPDESTAYGTDCRGGQCT